MPVLCVTMFFPHHGLSVNLEKNEQLKAVQLTNVLFSPVNATW